MDQSGLDEEKIRMLLEQMNSKPDQSKPLGQQSMGGGAFGPAKTDMGPLGSMAKGVGQINPLAGAASEALLGANDAVSGAIGGVLAAPGRLMAGAGRAIKGLRPFPNKNPTSPPRGVGGFGDLMGALVSQANNPPAPADAAPPPAMDARRMDSADWKPSPEANRIAIASAISPGAGMSQWGGEINAEADKNFDRNLEAKTIDAIVGAPPGHMGKPSPQMSEEERRRQELMNQYNPYARRGINPG